MSTMTYNVRVFDIMPENTAIVHFTEQLYALAKNRKLKIESHSNRKGVYIEHIICLKNLLKPKEIGISKSLAHELKVSDGEEVSVEILSYTPADSYTFIRKRMDGVTLTKKEIDAIIDDIVNTRMSDIEMTSLILTLYFKEFDISEITDLARSIAEHGEIIDFGDNIVFDKHSIGGVPGNKVSLLIVPIIAAAGLLIPKTSSRAITSPSGTADTMEAIGCQVSFTADEIKKITKKTKGMIVWGGSLNLAPADDILISKVEYPLKINPRSMMMASILAKKIAMNVNYLVLDIPTGKGTKMASQEEAAVFARDFKEIARRLGIRAESGITYGGTPVGHAIGPALEAREAIEALLHPASAPKSLTVKSCRLAGILLEISGKALEGQGYNMAKEILYSGKAAQKFAEIVREQHGPETLDPNSIELGQYTAEIMAPSEGWIVEIDNKAITEVARAAGAPYDKGAGVYFIKKIDSVNAGEPIIRIYSNSESRLDAALALYQQLQPITMESMLLNRI